ncbi:MAG TPA: alpha/beta hydrolase [Jatrophihabitans sp.]|jgi:pimeloyl-ACP methyl ester carboxylesterase
MTTLDPARLDVTDAPQWFTEALAAPVRVSTHRLSDGRRLALRSWGSGRRVVLLVHGGGAHARWWDHVAPLMLTAEETIVAVDLAGHGDSDWRAVDRADADEVRGQDGTAYDLESWADDLTELLAALAPATAAPPPVLIGHSMGGLVGWTTAARADSRLFGLIAVDAAIGDDELAAISPIRPVRPSRVYPGREEILARFRTLPEQPVTLPYVMQHVARTSIKPVDEGWTWRHDPAVLHHAYATTATPDLGRTRLSVLICERGVIRPPTLRYLAELAAGVEVRTLPKTGHHAMLDRPVALADALREILDAWVGRAQSGVSQSLT